LFCFPSSLFEGRKSSKTLTLAKAEEITYGKKKGNKRRGTKEITLFYLFYYFFVLLWRKEGKQKGRKSILFPEGKQNTKKNKGEGKTLEEITQRENVITTTTKLKLLKIL
jgi:hypothetical protein